MNSTAKNNDKAPLEDLMAAMDVVDTLRHDQSIAERELDGEGRRERLLKRLRNMYSAQGMEVPDHILEEGIDALEKERFQYIPVKKNWQTSIAKLWVSRSRWGKPVGFLVVLASVFYGFYYTTEVMPERSLRASLPSKVTRGLSQITATAKNPEVILKARQLAANARGAIANNNVTQAKVSVESLHQLQDELSQEYDIRVISKPNENSGVFRNPPGNKAARNYYLIVEAVDKRNQILELSIVNQENNQIARKKKWGLRVSKETFYEIASDKRDDGIIQNNKVGRKLAGHLKPEFYITTTGATITEW